MKTSFTYLILIFMFGCTAGKTVENEPNISKINYELNLTDYADDKMRVNITTKGLPQKKVTFCFPKIVPGIYGAMDFGKYIDSILVKDIDNNPIETKRVDLNCWEISNANKIHQIEYVVDDTWEVFDFQMDRGFYKSAASTFTEDVFLINANCLFGYFKGHETRPIELVIKKPEGFYGASSLARLNTSLDQDIYRAKDYAELVDNPVLYARPDTALIKLPDIDVEVACYSTTGKKIAKEIADYIKPLLENQTNYLKGKLPVKKYTFILYHNLNSDLNSYMGDGLEHSRSALILFYMPLDINVIKNNVYGIASHEFFHTLMPLGIHSHEIANYDFNNPVFSRHLWLYEGTTEYFTIHMPIKTGVQELPEFIDVLERKIEEMKAFDNSLSFTELSLNIMDYQDQYYNVYLKGALINLCLDIKLRELSQGAYGVQDLVLDLLDRYGVDKSFEDEKLFDEIVQISGFTELKEFFDNYVVHAEKLPLKEMLFKVGFSLENNKISELKKLSREQSELRRFWINQ